MPATQTRIETAQQLRRGLSRLRVSAHDLRTDLRSLRRELRGEEEPTPLVEAPKAKAKEAAPAKEPAADPADPAATKVLSLAERIAALDADFDPNARDDDFIDTGTPEAAMEQAARGGGEAVEAVIHEAPDGTKYWGPIDNDSARAKAEGETLIIDQIECINCGTCVENTAAVFVLPDDAKAVAYRQDGPMDLIQDAIDACPVTCIHWTEEPDQFPPLNDAAGRALE